VLLAWVLALVGVLQWLAVHRTSPARTASRAAQSAARDPRPAASSTEREARSPVAPAQPNQDQGAGAAAMNVTAELDAFHQRFVGTLHELPPWIEYEACRAQKGQSCEASWTAAVYLALTLAVQTKEGLALADELLNRSRPGELRDAVQQRMKSSDPLQRIMTLGLLNMNSYLVAEIDLPSEAYQDLSRRSVVETQLILTRHIVNSLPSEEVAREVHFMTLHPETDSRVLPIAVRTLGHAENAELLLDVTRHWLSPEGRSVIDPAALLAALQRCGPACASGIEAMAEDDRPEVREHAASFVRSAAAG
jgi:hypothetical protein